MARTLRRPMFRIGGMAHEQRTGYMGGGMTGIMSGITPRQPDAGLTPRMGLQEGSVEPDLKEYGQQDNRSSLEKFLDDGGRKMAIWYRQHSLERINVSDKLEVLTNLNSPEDLNI